MRSVLLAAQSMHSVIKGKLDVFCIKLLVLSQIIMHM